MNKAIKRALGLICLLTMLLPGALAEDDARPVREWLKVGKKELSINPEAPKEERSILLLVFDPAEGSQYGPADALLLATINTKTGEARMTVLQARLLVDIPGVGRDTLGQAFACGGENLAMKTVNEVFGLNVKDFVSINLARFPAVVQTLGGVDVTLSDEDAQALGLEPGTQCLDAEQTLAYMRLPHAGPELDRPYNIVMQTLYQGSRDKDIGKLTGMLRTVLGSMETNIGFFDMVGLGSKVMGGGERAEIRLPAADQLTATTLYGEPAYEADLPAAKQALHTFLFGE